MRPIRVGQVDVYAFPAGSTGPKAARRKPSGTVEAAVGWMEEEKSCTPRNGCGSQL
ncbi:MAG: hypothetical protein ACTSWP_05625 [Candidatus Freyarchaeota archaeon]